MEEQREKALEIIQSVDKKFYVVDLSAGYVNKEGFGSEEAAKKEMEEAKKRKAETGKYGKVKEKPWEKK